MQKKSIIIAIALSMVMTVTSFASAQPAEQDEQAALQDAEPYGEFVTNGDTGGLDYDEPSLTVSKKIGASGIPEKYDLRDKGWSTSVKDQGEYSFCWAFATLASIESNLLKKGIAKGDIDLSEAHLGYFNFHGINNYSSSSYAGKESFIYINGFSNYYESTATLSRRFGAVTESVMPYSQYGDESLHNDAVRTKHQYLLTGMSALQTSSTTKKLDTAGMNNVKRMIMNNGAAASVIYSANRKSDYGTDGASFYSAVSGFNHGVTIIGWDDNYPASKFSQKPAGNGAWLIKNSYGTSVFDNGYLWASYYCPSICLFSSFTAEKNDGSQIYQYDGLGLGNYGPATFGTGLSAANTFKARKDVLIDRVGTWTATADSKISVSVYVNKNNTSPASGTKLVSRSFSAANAGYHTLKLGKNAGIPKGAKFSLTVTVKDKNGKYTVPFEMCNLIGGDVKPAKLSKGQSYVKYTGRAWKDIKSEYNGAYPLNAYNATIKGIGRNAGTKAQKISAKSIKTVKKGKKFRIKARRVKGSGKLVYSTSNYKKATVSSKGVVKAKKKGTVKITVWALPTAKYKSAKKVVSVKIK